MNAAERTYVRDQEARGQLWVLSLLPCFCFVQVLPSTTKTALVALFLFRASAAFDDEDGPVVDRTVSPDTHNTETTTPTSPRRPQRRREVTDRYRPAENPVRRTAERRNTLQRCHSSGMRQGLRRSNTGRLTLDGQRRRRTRPTAPTATQHAETPRDANSTAGKRAPINPATHTGNADSNTSVPTAVGIPSVATANDSSTSSSTSETLSDSGNSHAQRDTETQPQGPRHTSTLPREWYGSVNAFDYSAHRLREETRIAVEHNLLLRANIHGAAHGRIPFCHVLEEIDRMIRTLASANYEAGHQQRLQDTTPNRHNWAHTQE